MASSVTKATVISRLLPVSLFYLLLLSCESNHPSPPPQPATYVTEKAPMIDSSHFAIIEKQFGYDRIDTLPSYLGGLQPKLPMAEVHSFSPKEPSLRMSVGLMGIWYSVVAKMGDSLVLMDTEQKFKDVFAPIESEQEAISYVAYLTHTYPRYTIEKEARYRVYASYFPAAHAKKVNGGYEVLLHDKKVYGCGPHPYFYKVFHVTDGGEIKLLQTVRMYEDPKEDPICVE